MVKKERTFILVLVIFFFIYPYLKAENPEWIIYNTSNSDISNNIIHCIAIDNEGNIWLGGDHSGLTKFDGTNWTNWNYENSDIPSGESEIISIAIDDSNNLWIGSDGSCLFKFNGVEFTEFLPGRNARYVAIDNSDNKWVGSFQGLAKFDNENWTMYDTSNSDLKYSAVMNIAIDKFDKIWAKNCPTLISFDGTNWSIYDDYTPSGWYQSIAIDEDLNIWIGTYYDGLVRFDGIKWTAYWPSISNFTYLGAIAIDDENNKWVGFDNGFAKFDGENWTVYDTLNSELPANWVTGIEIDQYGNKWLATWGGGLAVFNENGVIVNIDEVGFKELADNFYLYQNYPNPFNPSTIIRYNLFKSSEVILKIYNILGEEVRILVNDSQTAGLKEVVWNGKDNQGKLVNSGVYFYNLKVGNIEKKSNKMLFLK